MGNMGGAEYVEITVRLRGGVKRALGGSAVFAQIGTEDQIADSVVRELSTYHRKDLTRLFEILLEPAE